MKLQQLLNEFNRKSTITKVTLLLLVTIWTLIFTLIIGGIIFVMESPSEAQQSTPDFSPPAISLSPKAGSAGSAVTVQGQGWPADSQVLIYVVASERPSYAVASANVDSAGRFRTSFIVPSDPNLPAQGAVRILAQVYDGSLSAEASLDLISQPDEPGETPTQTGEPSATATLAPTSTPLPTDTPTASPALATVSANLNVRSGPDTSYPVLAVLSAGQTVEITGLSADYGWWQIRLPNAPEGRGWVSAYYVTAQNTGNVPIVQPATAPPTTTPTPTATVTPVPTSTPVIISDWRGEYFDNRSLSGAPLLVRNDVSLNFSWGSGSPAAQLPADNFSARWSRGLHFEAGTYRFNLIVDDGARVWVDDRLVIDGWYDGGYRQLSGQYTLSRGWHNVRVEYYERGGEAGLRLWWDRISDRSFPDWKGEYWSNRHLDGSPTYVRNDEEIDFDWGRGAPASGLPADDFSARWTQRIDFEAGTYRFYARADDGLRVYIDGDRVLDEWHSSDGDELYSRQAYLDGEYRIKVEYYEKSGDAEIEVWWERVKNTPTPTPTATATSTPTATPTATTVPGNELTLEAAINHLAAMTALPTSEIRVISQQAVTWNDAKLGCGPDDILGAQVLTPGYLIILEARGERYEYHTDEGTRVVLCQSAATPTPTATTVPSSTPSATPEPSETTSPTETLTPTAEPTNTATATPLPTDTPTETATPVPTETPTATVEPTNTPTETSVPTQTPTATVEPTNTPTETSVPTQTPTPTPLPTETPEPTASPVPTESSTPASTEPSPAVEIRPSLIE